MDESDQQISLSRPTISTIHYALVVDNILLIFIHVCYVIKTAAFRFHEAGRGGGKDPSADDVTLLFPDVEMFGDADGFALAD